MIQIGHFIRCFGSVDHLIKAHSINLNHSIISADNLLWRDIQHLLHHDYALTNAVYKRNDEVETRAQALDVPTKALYCPLIALRDKTNPLLDQIKGKRT